MRICSLWIGDNGTSCLQKITRERRPRNLCLGKKNKRDHTARRLPGSAVCRLSDGDQTPEALFELFQDWQRTQTQSSVTALRGRDSEWMSGSAKAGTTAERHRCELRDLAGSVVRAPPRRASGELCFLLTRDLHGCRLVREEDDWSAVSRVEFGWLLLNSEDLTVYKFDYTDVDEKTEAHFKCLKRLVGERGFEPPTPWSRIQRPQ